MRRREEGKEGERITSHRCRRLSCQLELAWWQRRTGYDGMTLPVNSLDEIHVRNLEPTSRLTCAVVAHESGPTAVQGPFEPVAIKRFSDLKTQGFFMASGMMELIVGPAEYPAGNFDNQQPTIYGVLG